MNLSNKQPNRELYIFRSESDFILIERTRYVPIGHTKGKWQQDSVLITADELYRLVEFAKQA